MTNWKEQFVDTFPNLSDNMKFHIGGFIAEKVIEKLIDEMLEITTPESPPSPNSEYHNGFESARVAYAEAKLRKAKQLRNEWL